MSLTGAGCIEVIDPVTGYVRDVAMIAIDSIPHLEAVLAFPWGKHSPDDDLPPPVVKPRGFPKNVGLSVLHKVGLYVDEKEAKKGNNDRAITARKAKKLRKLVANGLTYYLDPDVKCPTWLSRFEVCQAAVSYFTAVRHPSLDLEGVAAMMASLERPLPTGACCTTRFVVWFT